LAPTFMARHSKRDEIEEDDGPVVVISGSEGEDFSDDSESEEAPEYSLVRLFLKVLIAF
jgi:hypothetical protein